MGYVNCHVHKRCGNKGNHAVPSLEMRMEYKGRAVGCALGTYLSDDRDAERAVQEH